jgi:hypothetical protein
LRRRGHQHLAPGRADTAERLPVQWRGHAAAGELRAVGVLVEKRLLDADLVPVDVELFGNEHGEHGANTLSDLRVLGQDCY